MYNVEDIYALSPVQQGMLFHSLYAPDSGVYCNQDWVDLTGRLDTAVLKRAWEAVVERHGVLRTAFVWEELEEPVQVVQREVALPFAVLDWREVPPAERAGRLAEWMQADRARGFVLSEAPLLRITAIRLGEEAWRVIWTWHHSLMDGWSSARVSREVFFLYGALTRGEQPRLPQPRAYADYIAWLQEQELEAAERFWRETLRGFTAPTPLPGDRLSAQAGGSAGPAYAAAETTVSAEVVAALQALARQQKLTLNTLVQGAWAVLLNRYSGEGDVLFGTTVSGRPAELDSVEEMVGLFINSLPVRVRVDREEPVLDLLQRLQALQVEMRQFEHSPLVEVQGWSEVPRTLPFFESLLVFENYPVDQSSRELPGGLGLERAGAFEPTNYPITLLVVPQQELKLYASFDTARFSAEVVSRVLDHLGNLLAAIAADPTQPVGRLPILGAAETASMLYGWNQTAADYPRDRCIHELFEAQARQTPDRPALLCGGQTWTYRELNERADRLAGHLRSLGVSPGALVGVLLERSAHMVAALLGILKAGGAYVPMDPSYPRERLQFMLADAAISVLVTEEAHRHTLETGPFVRLLCADQELPPAEALPAAPVTPGDLAYVIYTSGSTGRPKGVQVEHRSVVNFLAAMRRAPGLTAADTLLAVTSISFDIAGLELFLPLTAGARAVLADRETAADGRALAALLAQSGATVMQATPSTWRLLLEAGWRNPRRIRALAGGEPLPRDLADRLLALGAELWNLYGPTETTIWSAAHRVEAGGRAVPIGRPIANTAIYILDDHLSPVPAGAAGELYIGGDGLARGYLNRPDLTAERFIASPFRPGERLYRTGDSARYSLDGTIDYLGRLDDQVKVRGFRIELGEVEAALHRSPAVRDAAVAVRRGADGSDQLVAYLVPSWELPAAIPAEEVARWQEVWDETYKGASRGTGGSGDAALNTAGWNSSYTGQPIPDGEMREWADQTVEQILALQPRRAMEIGCGTGLLLLRIAPRVERYHGVDFSASALDYVRRQTAALPQVTLEQAEAAALEAAPGSYDLVILNSVVQYFPDAGYLAGVLSRAVEAVAPGGAVFVGDVRSLPLLEPFHASVELFRAPDQLPAGRLRQRVRRRVTEETELMIDPAFFHALQQRLPRISRVEVSLKRGRYRNELGRFRYDVVLHVGQSREAGAPAVERLAWAERSPASLEPLLRERGGRPLLLAGVPNARVADACQALRLLAEADYQTTAAELRRALGDPQGVEPEELRELADRLGYQAAVTWGGAPDRFDVLFFQGGMPALEGVSPAGGPHTNDPARGRALRQVVPALRSELRERLPEYMIPSAYLLLDALPLTPNGKVDRKALPAPDGAAGAGSARPYEAPRTRTEEAVAALWAQVLGVERVSVHDHFFELGGHSLMATQVVARLREGLQADISVRTLFEHPTVAALSARIDGAAPGEAAAPIQPVPRERELPLSFAQQRLWFLDQMEPGRAEYNMPFAVRLSGHLDLAALRQSLAEIVRRHEVLRTVYKDVEGRPVQIVLPAAGLELPVADVTEEEAASLAAAEAARPFDLGQGPMLRARLLRLAPEVHILLLTIHHIAFDGWSIGLLLQEVAALYGAFAAGRPSPLPDLPVQYAEFAHWQQEQLDGPLLDEQLAWWQERLQAMVPLALPTDHPRPPVRSGRGAVERFTLSPELTERLKAFSRREGATLFMTLLAAWQALLHRYTGQDDIGTGTPAAGRTRTEMEGLIGFFVSTLVMRGDLRGRPSFRELLARVRSTAVEAYARQELPFERLVEALQPERDPSRTPLVQVMFSLQNAPIPRLSLPGLRLVPLESHSGTAKFDLTLDLRALDGGLAGTLEYSTDLYEAATIRRMIGHFTTLLEGAVTAPDQAVAHLPLLTAAEAETMLLRWNETDTPYPRDRTVHALFEEQAARRPEAIAVAFGEERLTYAELNRRANRLAHRLRRLGVGHDSPVAICAGRSAAMITGLLGILKAGGAYVPLDPDYPAERLAFMLRDSAASVLVTAAQEIPMERDLHVIDLAAGPLEGESDENPAGGATPESLAYVMYTSGSTGRPKGTGVPHRAIARLVCEPDYAALRPDDRVAQASNASFDATTFEIWGALVNGACLVGVAKETLLSPQALAANLREQRITALFLTTGLFNQVAREAPDAFRSLRHLLFGGEAADPHAVRAVLRGGPPERLVNAYGPTETTTFATWHLVTAVAEEARTVPIGRPISRTQVYVLDRHLEPVPVGVPGELYIGGDGLARGYLGRPDLTAERFVPSPFAPGGRLYRTGDLVRWLPDGTLEFLGRLDHQVKLRGFRIELGEIEAALASHPAVRQALATLREDEPGQKRLVAYLVADGDADWRGFLRERLPEYMLPAAFVTLDAFPLTPNGKVDRAALPAPEGAWTVSYTAPRTPLEEQLCDAFAQVLALNRVSIHDAFFELGGHSLLAMQLIARIRSSLGVELPVRALFETPTAAGLAEAVAKAGAAAAPPITAATATGEQPLSFAQQRLWFLEQMSPGTAEYNVPFFLRLAGPLDVAALRASLQEVARRHEVLRTAYRDVEGRPVQVVAPAAGLELPVTDVTEEAAASLAAAEAARPFDLAHGSMLRARLLRLAPEVHLLLLTVHHIAFDGWSMGVMLGEVAALYPAFLAGGPSPLPALPVQYADYARWQREWLQGAALERELAYWSAQLEGLEPLDLPADHPRPPVRSGRGATLTFTLDRTLAEQLKRLSRQAGATLFMTLLAAFNLLLHRYTGRDDLAVGTPVAGRTRAETEGLIGFFVNTLVLRTDLAGDPTFLELLARVRETATAAYAHQDLPFERLVETLRPGRDTARTPLFQVLFALQNAPIPQQGLPGLTLEPLPVEAGVAKTDLAFSLEEGPDGLLGTVNFSTDLFEPATIRRMTDHFRTLLEGAVADPDRPVADLPLLTAAEAEELLIRWNDTAAPYPRHRTLHELVEEQAARRPDAIAVAYGPEQLTYGELNRRANRLARRLRALGVGPDLPVAICLERSASLILAILAILKAGGAYLPIDPDYPTERLAYLLADSAAPVLLTREGLLARLPEDRPATLCLDALPEGGDEATGDENLPPAAGPEHLAYVIYTSGSTGLPKGTGVPHRALVNLLFTGGMRLTEADRQSQLINIAFDPSAFEIFAALTSGARLVGLARETALAPAALARTIRAEGITSMICTAAVLHQIVREEPGALSTLRQLMCGGEALDPAIVRLLLRHGAPGFLANGYGPTEATVWSALYRANDLPEGATTVPIGRPVGNTAIYVLDRRLRPVPVGVPGELCIGGDGLARGYLGRPDLTAERFVPNPFRPGERLYRTGDLARWLPDGTLEFLGRLDDQVKLRGFRIELGEVEAALAAHPAVRQALALVREDRPGDRRLAVYLVAAEPADWRGYLRERLPDYMIPSAFVMLEALPLTPNGKVDRAALPVPAYGDEAGAFEAPRTPLEEALCSAVAAVLGVSRVSIHDSFFDLGGHSLLVTQLLSRIRAELGVEVPVRAVFEAPTVAGLAAAVLRAGAAAVPPITAAPPEGEVPLSFAQQRLWFIDQMDPGSAEYNVPFAIRLAGRLDAEALRQGLREVVRRHAALRTTFAIMDGRPVQVVAPAADLDLPVTALAPGEVEPWLRAEGARPFDLGRGPLIRAHLLRLSEQEHVLFVGVHHIAFDGWSAGLFLRELSTLYEAFAAGRPSPLPEPALQYADFARWQRRWLDGPALAAQLDWWRESLAGLEPLALPADRPRPPVRSGRGAVEPIALSPDLTARLRALARAEGATLFMTLLAAWQGLLHRYSGQEGFAVGSPIAGRNRAETEELIGFFVNTLVLRADLSGSPTFRELLARVRSTAMEAYARQDLPFERLVEALQPERDPSRTPLVQVMFALQNAPMPAIQLPGLTLAGVDLHPGTAKCDLSLALAEAGDGLAGSLEYSADLYEAETVRRMIGHFRTLLEGAVADPDRPVADLPLLTAAEAEELLIRWNDTAAPYPRYRTLHELVEEQAARRPDAIAVVYGPEQLTYGELNRRANRLARRLRALGVGPDLPVAICMERSATLILAILAILKAGGAYLPIDPDYPAERLAYLLADSAAPVLLTREGLLARLPEDRPATLCLDALPEGGDEATGDENLPPAAGPEHLAYVIYTSGSTGLPKGTGVPHRALVNLLFTGGMRLTEADRQSQLINIAFDPSAFEIFAALTSGARLVGLTRETALDPAALARTIRAEGITSMLCPAAILHQIVREEPGALSTLRQLLTGGEAVDPAIVRLLQRHGAPGFLANGYGPTEATVWSALYRANDLPEGAVTVPIGRPVGNTAIYVLDRRLRPVPVGVPGELCIGGDGLARGYLGRPDLTAERFVPNPFRPGERLYRTGDLARWLPDGTLEFLGRMDDQVKLRGFRIELGEVEAALASHPAVSQALALVREDRPGDRRLAAYLVAAEPADWRGYLRERLPDYMIPSAFVILDALPLTPNGKVDRRALPVPAYGDEAGAFVAPRTPAEEALCAVFAAVLGLSRVSVHDSFFALGGHSLLAVQLLSRIRAALGVELPVRALFEAPTVAGLAARVAKGQGAGEAPGSLLVPIRPEGSRRPLFLVHPVGGNVFCYAELASRLEPDQPVYGLQSRGLSGAEPPLASIEEMAAAYIERIRAVQPQGPYRLGGWSMGGAVAFAMACQLEAGGERVELLALIDSVAPERARKLGQAGGETAEEEWLAADLAEAQRLLAVFRANREALLAYVPQRYGGQAALILAGDTPPEVSAGAAGWAGLAAAIAECRVPGDHYSIFHRPQVDQLAARIQTLLTQLNENEPGGVRA